jgi:hypothetical protein
LFGAQTMSSGHLPQGAPAAGLAEQDDPHTNSAFLALIPGSGCGALTLRHRVDYSQPDPLRMMHRPKWQIAGAMQRGPTLVLQASPSFAGGRHW